MDTITVRQIGEDDFAAFKSIRLDSLRSEPFYNKILMYKHLAG